MNAGGAKISTPWEDLYQQFQQTQIVYTERASVLREEIQKKQEELKQIDDVLYLLQGALDRSTPISLSPVQGAPITQNGYGIASEKEATHVRNTSSESTRTY